MHRIIGGILVIVLAVPVATTGHQVKDKPATPATQYQALLKESEAWEDIWSKAFQAAKTDEEEEKLNAESTTANDKFSMRFLELAEKNRKDPLAFDALVWVVSHTCDYPDGMDSPRSHALAILLRDHVQSDKLGQVCERMWYEIAYESETFLRTVLEKSSHKDVQGLACLALAQVLNLRLQQFDLLKAEPDSAKRLEAGWGKEFVAKLQRQDHAKLVKEIEALFDQAADKYGDLKWRSGDTVAQFAKRALFDIRNLAVGREAPDIEGTDQQGKKFKLSDYRGKVVLLDFWSRD